MSVYGLPKYSQGEEHTLTAFYLAVGGYYWKDGDLKGTPYVSHIGAIEVSDDIKQDTHPSVVEREQTARSGWKLIKTTSRHKVSKNPKARDLGQPKRRGLGDNNFSRGGDFKRGSF